MKVTYFPLKKLFIYTVIFFKFFDWIIYLDLYFTRYTFKKYWKIIMPLNLLMFYEELWFLFFKIYIKKTNVEILKFKT